MHDARLSHSRSILIAILTMLIYFLVPLILADFFLLLITLGNNPIPNISRMEILLFLLSGAGLLAVIIFAWEQLTITPNAVARHLKRYNFQVIVSGRSLLATKGIVELGLFLKRTRHAYQPYPIWRVVHRGGRWVREQHGSFNPSYMYKEGSLKVILHKQPIAANCLQEFVNTGTPPQCKERDRTNVVRVIEKRVGAWMGKYLLLEIDLALHDIHFPQKASREENS